MYIAIDLGAESGRVIAGNLEKLHVVHRFESKSVRLNGHLYWDAPAIFSEILKGLKTAFEMFPNQIRSIGIDTWGVDYALLDENQQLLGNPFHYRDDRNDGFMQQVCENLGKNRIYEATGIQFLPFNTIYQLAEEVANRSERLKAAHSFLTIPDLLNFWLCGVRANEFSNATTTQLYDPVQGDWAWELIDSLRLPRRIFGDVVMPGTVLGELKSDVKLAVGAPDGVVVVTPACHDTGSAVAAMPVAGDSSKAAYLSSGTWSLLGCELKEALITDETLKANFTNEGGVNGSFRFLKNIMGLWILQECRRSWSDAAGNALDYGHIVELAHAAGKAAVIIDVDDERFLKPSSPEDSMLQRVLQVCSEQGLQVSDDAGTVSRIILESLAARYAQNLQQVEKLTGQKLETLYIIGGGSQNDLLSDLTARASGLKVYAGPVEATALGNILVQALAAGEISTIEEGRLAIGKHHEIKIFE